MGWKAFWWVEKHFELLPSDLVIIPPGMHHRVEIFNDGVMLNILVEVPTFRDLFLQNLVGNATLFHFFRAIIWEGKHSSLILMHTGKDAHMSAAWDMAILPISSNNFERKCRRPRSSIEKGNLTTNGQGGLEAHKWWKAKNHKACAKYHIFYADNLGTIFAQSHL